MMPSSPRCAFLLLIKPHTTTSAEFVIRQTQGEIKYICKFVGAFHKSEKQAIPAKTDWLYKDQEQEKEQMQRTHTVCWMMWSMGGQGKALINKQMKKQKKIWT